jgi:hypothetical protein
MAAIATALADVVTSFRGATEAGDDVTFLLVRLAGAPAVET